MSQTWKDILELGGKYLAGRGIPESDIAMELAMARLLRCGRGLLAPHLSEVPPERYVEAMRRAVARLAKGEPIQYVLGEWDFRSLTLKCDKRALIPRPETEELVTRVIRFLKPYVQGLGGGTPLVVDVGTGTGCIALSLAKEFAGPVYLGIDISEAAVELANENAAKTGLADRVRFAVGDGLDDFDEPQSVDVIVSNPPYISTSECATLDPRIRLHEPMNALDGGPEGLDFYERLAGDAVNLLKPGGAVFFEIGDRQGEAVRQLLFDCGFESIAIEKDYAGHDRYASGVLP